MKRIMNLLALVAISMTVFSCTKGGSSSSTNGTFTLKYEVITSSPIVTNTTFGTPKFTYENGTQQPETDNSFTTGTTWTKTITVTTTTRPYEAILTSGTNPVCLGAAGTVTSNIYVNGAQVAHAVNNTNAAAGGINYAVISMNYWIQ